MGLSKFFRDWIRREDGTVAIEFSLVWMPVLYMSIAILEIGMYFAAANTLEYALSTSSRMIRTGQLQTSNPPDMQLAFKNDLCTHLMGLIDCDSVDLEVIPLPDNSFTNADNFTPVYDKTTNHLVSHGFDPGEAGSVVLLRVAYRYSMWTPLLSTLLSHEPDGKILMISTVVLENEPYKT